MSRTIKTVSTQARALSYALVDPDKLYGSLQEGLGSWVPLTLLSVATAFVSYFAIFPVLDVLPRDRTLELTPEQVSQGVDFIRRFRVLMAELSPLAAVIKWAVAALLVWMSCLALEVDLKYERVFRLVVYASVIPFLHELLKLGLMIYRSREASTVMDVVPATGLNLAFPGSSPPLAALLASVNIFELWFLVVLAAGVRALGPSDTRRAALAVVPVWVCFTGVQVASAFVGFGGVR